MIYAQFWMMSAPGYWNNHKSTPVEACGDRGVVILDGRNSRVTHHEIAKAECAKRGYVGYSLHAGESFTRSAVISTFQPVSKE